MSPARPWQAPVRLIGVAVLTNAAGNFALSRGMRDLGETVTLSPLPYLAALANPWVFTGVCLLSAWLIAQLSLLSRADLSYVLPTTSLSYVLAAVLATIGLGERISAGRWTGILFIALGVWLVARTQPRTGPERRR